jgi:hypothetical protein
VNGRERQKGNLARPFDRQGQLTLVLGTVAGYSPGNDLSSFRYEITESFRIFIIYPHIGIYAETADFSPSKCTSFAPDNHDIFSLCCWVGIRVR